MRLRKKANLSQRLAACGGRWVQQPGQLRGHWRSLMPDAREIHLEIGCGKGRFTVEMALRHPDWLWIGVERSADAMVTAAEKARDLGLENLFFLDLDAGWLGQYFAPGEVQRIYLNFSDPWPSSRQAYRRLSHPDFLMRYRGILSPGGAIEMKTDNAGLFEWSLFQFPKAGFRLEEVCRDLHRDGPAGVMTDYEEKFYRQGKPICRCTAVMEALPAEMSGWKDPLAQFHNPRLLDGRKPL